MQNLSVALEVIDCNKNNNNRKIKLCVWHNLYKNCCTKSFTTTKLEASNEKKKQWKTYDAFRDNTEKIITNNVHRIK